MSPGPEKDHALASSRGLHMSCLKSASSFPMCVRGFGLLLPIQTRLLPVPGEHSAGMG